MYFMFFVRLETVFGAQVQESSQGDKQDEMENPFVQKSSQGDGKDEVKSNQAEDDLARKELEKSVEVPEDKEAEIAEFVARLVASLIMTAVLSVSNELDKAFNDEVRSIVDAFLFAQTRPRRSQLLFTTRILAYVFCKETVEKTCIRSDGALIGLRGTRSRTRTTS